MNDEYLLYTAISLYSLCYIVVFYADIKNKNTTIYNLPDRFMVFTASTLTAIYSYRIKNYTFFVNYIILLVLESCNICIKIYFIRKNYVKNLQPTTNMIDETSSPIHSFTNQLVTEGHSTPDFQTLRSKAKEILGVESRICFAPLA